MFRTKAVENLTKDAPFLNLTKEQFIEAYINDQFEYDYPEIKLDAIIEQIDGIVLFHRIAQIVKPSWLTRELAKEIHEQMQSIVDNPYHTTNRGFGPC